ncbi:MAG: hypothetical protein JOZ78_07900 [Chroococcidiopsidaceae cyanobacterium CP_BM_ER_R8_30]|nr:hypothetical protein [Chroococcidiopsidaceae cyanobacterium CP_BM_ER_R8_30]
MKVLRQFLNTNQIDIELKKIGQPSFQTEIQEKLERLWEETCLELTTHPREYCLMDTAPIDSYLRNFAWGLDAIIKARLEMNFSLESQGLQTEESVSDRTKAELEIKEKQLDIIDEQRLRLGKRHFEVVNAAPAKAGRCDFIDRKGGNLERLVPFSRIGSRTPFSWLKRPGAIIAGSLLFFALLFGLGQIHSERMLTKTQSSPQTHSTRNSAHT